MVHAMNSAHTNIHESHWFTYRCNNNSNSINHHTQREHQIKHKNYDEKKGRNKKMNRRQFSSTFERSIYSGSGNNIQNCKACKCIWDDIDGREMTYKKLYEAQHVHQSMTHTQRERHIHVYIYMYTCVHLCRKSEIDT